VRHAQSPRITADREIVNFAIMRDATGLQLEVIRHALQLCTSSAAGRGLLARTSGVPCVGDAGALVVKSGLHAAVRLRSASLAEAAWALLPPTPAPATPARLAALAAAATASCCLPGMLACPGAAGADGSCLAASCAAAIAELHARGAALPTSVFTGADDVACAAGDDIAPSASCLRGCCAKVIARRVMAPAPPGRRSDASGIHLHPPSTATRAGCAATPRAATADAVGRGACSPDGSGSGDDGEAAMPPARKRPRMDVECDRDSVDGLWHAGAAHAVPDDGHVGATGAGVAIGRTTAVGWAARHVDDRRGAAHGMGSPFGAADGSVCPRPCIGHGDVHFAADAADGGRATEAGHTGREWLATDEGHDDEASREGDGSDEERVEGESGSVLPSDDGGQLAETVALLLSGAEATPDVLISRCVPLALYALAAAMDGCPHVGHHLEACARWLGLYAPTPAPTPVVGTQCRVDDGAALRLLRAAAEVHDGAVVLVVLLLQRCEQRDAALAAALPEALAEALRWDASVAALLVTDKPPLRAVINSWAGSDAAAAPAVAGVGAREREWARRVLRLADA
jgi:hypothetical protein